MGIMKQVSAALMTVLLNHPVNHDISTATCAQNLPYNKSDPYLVFVEYIIAVSI